MDRTWRGWDERGTGDAKIKFARLRRSQTKGNNDLGRVVAVIDNKSASKDGDGLGARWADDNARPATQRRRI